MKRTFNIILYLLFATFLYGFFLRSWLSTETIRDEVVVIEPGTLRTFNMNLQFQRVVDLKYEVLEGGPVDIFLVSTDSLHQDSRSMDHIPGFSSIATVSGETDALPETGKWSILVVNNGTSDTPTKVKVLSQIYRPRFFKRTEKTEKAEY